MASSKDDFEARIGRTFRKKTLLREALTHSSAAEGKAAAPDYERLEFLGDRVLGLVVCEHLYGLFPKEGEDKLAPRFNALVNRDACARAARRAGIGPQLVLSAAEARTGGREKDTILADACEALIAALYLDGGIKAARAFIETYWADEFLASGEAPQDPKTALQEWTASRKRPNPRYDVVERSGPDHAPRFVVEAVVEGLETMRGEGGSKRDAEREAARAALKQVGVRV
ncbi:MAG: ribonuclease III [Alphaproteobacteria bacterium]|nr:ribonuclease III [Alphaproteobacteria bacterium]